MAAREVLLFFISLLQSLFLLGNSYAYKLLIPQWLMEEAILFHPRILWNKCSPSLASRGSESGSCVSEVGLCYLATGFREGSLPDLRFPGC